MNLEEYDILTTIEKVGYFENLPDSQRKVARKLVYGIGLYDHPKPCGIKFRTGDSFKTRSHPVFYVWRAMIHRCYISNDDHYRDVTIAKDWLTFSNFYSWWKDNYEEGFHLDKDILTDNREYSPENCLYVPRWLNAFIVTCKKNRGDAPLGSYWDKTHSKFRVNCSTPEGSMHVGYFASASEAYDAWKSFKLDLALQRKEEMDKIDTKVYPRVVEIVKRMS